MKTIVLLSAVAVVVVLAPVQAVVGPNRVLWWGNLAQSVGGPEIDADSGPYEADRIHGVNQTWAEILARAEFQTMFENQARAPQIFLTDDAVYVPAYGAAPETGLRRTELIPKDAPESVMTGVTTFHFSVRKDAEHPLNKTHEYQLVFIENSTEHLHVFELQYGTKYQNSSELIYNATDADMLRLVGNKNSGADHVPVLFETRFTPDMYHNFAVTIDWNNSSLTAFYSAGIDELQQVVPTTPNRAVAGELHIGMVKLPVGIANDVFTEGIQESGIRESLMFGGVFVEDSSNGDVTTIGEAAQAWQQFLRQHNRTE